MAGLLMTGESLDRECCVALLATVHIGRVVFTSRALPAVRPVRFAVRDGAVLFRMPVGDMWPAGVLDTVIAFTVDDATPNLEAGWFVTVLGRAGKVWDRRIVDELAAGHGCDDDRYVRVPIESVSGHRIGPLARRAVSGT